MPTLTISTDYTATLADDVILIDVTAGPIDLTLPAVHSVGKRFTLKHKAGPVDTNPITVASADADTIDAQPDFTFTVNKQALILHSDGSNWFIL